MHECCCPSKLNRFTVFFNMKFFGWGKSKAPQSETVLQPVHKTDPRNSNPGQDGEMHILPCKSSKIRKQEGLFEVDDDDKAAVRSTSSSGTTYQKNEEKLQDTIRFVFSLEPEGLLAIGTFALEQLAAISDDNSDQQRRQISDEFESCTDFDEDEEVYLPRLVKSSCEFPSDLKSCGDESDDDDDEIMLQQATKPDSKVFSLYRGTNRSSELAETKTVILLTALPPVEHRKTLDPASPTTLLMESLVPSVPPGHWTDSAPPVGELPKANVDPESYSSSYFCGLFGSNKPPSRSEKAKRIRTQRKIMAEDCKKVCGTKPADPNTKKSLLNFGINRVPSSLEKFWRFSGLYASARIAPERKTGSPRARPRASKGAAINRVTNGEVFKLTTPVTLPFGRPCDLNMRPPGWFSREDARPEGVVEFRRVRVAMQERNMPGNSAAAAQERRDEERDRGGHWIKDDSEYVVLEM